MDRCGPRKGLENADVHQLAFVCLDLYNVGFVQFSDSTGFVWERSGTCAHAVYARFSRFCHVGVFGTLVILRCCDSIRLLGYKRVCLQSLALPRGPCERCEITDSTKNGGLV